MAITAKEVNELRKTTGAGMMDCKKALTEAEGDFDKAIEILRKKGQKVSEKRADRETSEGAVFVRIAEDGKKGFALSLTCETDFVAKSDDFVKTGEAIADAVAANGVADAEAIKGLSIEGGSVESVLTDLMGKIGEKIEVKNFELIEADQVAPYIHSNGKVGVLVGLTGASGEAILEAGKDVAMQVAAMKPMAVDASGIAEDIKEREMKLGREQALAEGKPEKIVDKIAEGKLQRFYKDNTLLKQPFVKDSGKSVEQFLKEVDGALTVKDFKLILVG